MPRYFVENKGKWNIFSTIVDDFLFDEFVCITALKVRLLYEEHKRIEEDINSLLTDRPKVNVMSYEEAMELIRKNESDSEKPNNCKVQTIRCPKCGRTDYIRDMEKDMGIKGSYYKYKCVNCNTYIKDEPTISKMEQVKQRSCDTCKGRDIEGWKNPCLGCTGFAFYEPKDEPQIERNE